MPVRMLVAAVLLAGAAQTAGAVIISVPGTSDPWLAGMPNGSAASGGDFAPGQSPAEVTGLAFAPGDLLRFSATGSTDHCTGGGCGLAGAEGDAFEPTTGHTTGIAGAENGIANIVSPIDALIGIFLDAAQPSLSAAPGGLDFSTPAARDFALLAPLLKQPFFIGDGLRNDGLTVQSFLVPAGATRLFLGTMDGFGWFNNVGSLRVTVELQGVPEPASLVLLGIALAGLGFARGRFLPQC